MAKLGFLNSIGERKDHGDSIDIVQNYNWTVSNKSTARNEAPRIIITERQQSVSSIRQSIEYWANQAKKVAQGQIGTDPYAGLYAVDPNIIGNTYTLPYYNTYHHIVENTWGENKGIIGKTMIDVSNAVTQFARVLYPSAGIEAAKSWEGTTPARYQFSF